MSTDKDVLKAVTTPFDELRALETRHDEMRDLLIDIIQILDYSYTKEVQDTSNAIGLIRMKVDNLLN